MGQVTNIDSLKKIINDAAPDTAKVVLLDDLCWEYMYEDPQQAISYAEEALSLAKKLSYRNGEGSLLLTLGVIYANLSNYDKAVEFYLKAIEIKREVGNRGGEAACLSNLGNIESFRGNYNVAIEYYMKGLRIFEELNKREQMATMYNNLGTIYEYQQDYDQMRLYANKALETSEEIGYKIGIMSAKVSLGNVWNAKSHPSKALPYFAEALSIAEALSDQITIAICFHNMALTYFNMDRLEESLAYYNRQLVLAEKINSPNDRMFGLMGIGQVYLAQGRYSIAKEKLLESLHIATSMGSKQIRQDLYLLLSDLFTSTQNLTEALRYHRMYASLKDSLFNEAKAQQINELNIKYETEKKESEIRMLNTAGQLQKAEIRRKSQERNFFIIGFIIVLILTVILYRSIKHGLKANRLLEKQKRELEELNDLKSKLFSMISHDLRGPLSSMHGLLQILKEKKDVELEPFMEHANAIVGNTIHLLDNLLYWSADQVKGISMQMEKVSLSEVIEEIIVLYHVMLEAKKITVVNQINEVWVWADEPSVKLAFRNLVSNAIKFTHSGGSIYIATSAKDENTCVTIKDTGVGMSIETLNNLFTRHQLTGKGTQQEKGVGLGLFLSRDFIERNGGNIYVESEEGKGTAFTVTLKTYHPTSPPNRFTKRLSTTFE